VSQPCPERKRRAAAGSKLPPITFFVRHCPQAANVFPSNMPVNIGRRIVPQNEARFIGKPQSK
jgi:hypothetical protein